MLSPRHALPLAAALLLLGGCCKDTLREMTSLKDMAPRAPHAQKSATPKVSKASAKADTATQAAEVEVEDKSESAIETGSVQKPDSCQGAHVAYQATREYLKNFGPRPADRPGEKGPCMPDAQ
ncbi:hypothetical protein W911_17455 [Hyphomicrobium nitrativorans NL23]|uniref:Lipoprotein n=1 Tax=Hyphomicrobium nitrativorans NL23 TaxID=1029756 RepID=V5SKG2_9HYPH|nr:hypothetical protein [Hyphomicrobium nitrativorans]AHB50469.1 hypothetical protein W911_17455 [Hyphomicrobium nitrativorans NL23]